MFLASDVLLCSYRVYTDGEDSAVVFNGLVPLSDARFTSNTNFLSGDFTLLHVTIIDCGSFKLVIQWSL